MATLRRRATGTYRFRLAVAGALVTLISAFGGLGEALHLKWLWLGSCSTLIIGALIVLWLKISEQRASDQTVRLEAFDRLATTRPDRQRVPLVRELSAYELGADPEAIGSEEAAAYLPRDRDAELTAALERARSASQPSMVILRGPSKSGKSRTLFEAVLRDPVLRDAAVLAPRDRTSLAELFDGGLPPTPQREVVLWLDDLERFLSAGHDGVDRVTLDALMGWDQHVVVVATAGGKGADQFVDGGLSVPIRQLYNHRRVHVVSLASELTRHEQRQVQERFRPEIAQQVLAHGIGEYLVAAPELARKLDEERHRPADETCPEGAAVAWAAIDWARSGMSTSISEQLLREIWPLYLRGIPATDERFAKGLDWALRPVYRSVALVYETTSYEAYDWIVAHAASRLSREINARAWERMMLEVDPQSAFDIAVAAYRNGSLDESRRAFTQAAACADTLVAAKSAFNLGCLLAAEGDRAGARGAYTRAMASAEPEPAAMAALNLGILLQEDGDGASAVAAYRRAVECDVPRHSSVAALNLGLVLTERDDVDGARLAYATAAGADDPALASRAHFMLGSLLGERQPEVAVEALRRAVELGDPELAPAAGLLLGELLTPTDPAAARAAFTAVRETAGSALATVAAAHLAELDTPAPTSSDDSRAAFTRALEREGAGDVLAARADYEEVMASGAEDLAAAAAFNLGVLLGRGNEPIAAGAAYQRAIDSGHPKITPAASYGLGALLAQQGDVAGARVALDRAAAAPDRDIAVPAAAALRRLLKVRTQ